MPNTSVIILNWNEPELTVECVKSVLNQTYEDFEIILIDNASEDDSFEIFGRELRDEKINQIRCHENIGYAGGNNTGVLMANGEYVVILNNDTIVEKDWLEHLVNAIESDEKIGSVSSFEIREGKDLQGKTISLVGYPSLYTKSGELVDIFAINGVSFIYRKELAIPPFDPEYFIYAEDTYLGWLLKLKGYDNKLSFNSIVRHYHNTTRRKNRKTDEYFTYLGERNRIMNYLIFYELKNVIRIMPLMVMSILFGNLSEPSKIYCRLKSYTWIIFNLGRIAGKRRNIQKQRIMKDSDLISQMSCRFRDKELSGSKKAILDAINGIFSIYCSLVGLKTIEKC